MKRIDGKPPFGGDYAEFHFLDAENNEVDEGKETSIVIRECKADGTLVKETWARVFDNWYKNNPTDVIWWKDTPDGVGEWLFSFDKKTVFNMFADYPKALTPEQKQIFDKENPERCLPIRKHRGAREKRYSFGYAVSLILALMK